MGLLDTAAEDLANIVGDPAGFSTSLTLTDPSGQSETLLGLAADIGQTLDADTGETVTGRTASVTFSKASLRRRGLDMPRNIADRGAKPWVVEWRDHAGTSHTYKIREAWPDATLDAVTCLVEVYAKVG